MLITKEVTMDLNYRQAPIVMDALQGDTGRELRIHFTAGGEPWNVPEGGNIVVQYQCEDGSGGVFDTLPDGTPAYSIDENVLTICLAAQLCAVAGSTKLQVTILSGGVQISTVHMEIRVAPQLCPETAAADYTNLGQWLEENGKIGPQGPKGDKGDKGDMGDLTPEAEALRDEMKALSDKTEESADRAEEAAQKLEGGLVLRKGDATDSIVHGITPEQNADGTWKANQSTATAEAAVAFGKYNAVSGKNSMAVNYKNRVTAERAFAANEDNTVAGKRSAAFGWKNNAASENGFVAGKANTLESTAVNGAVFGESNYVSGQGAFVAGGYNNVAGGYTTALGYKNTVSGQQSFAIGAENEVSGANDFVGGYNNDVFGDYGFVVGANNKVAKGIQNAAVFGVKNEVTGGGGCVVNGSYNTLSGVYANAFGSRNVVSGNAAFAAGQWLQAIKEGQSVFGRYNSPGDEALFLVGNGTSDTDRKNAFEVHGDRIVVGGIELPAEMLKYHYDGYAEIAADNDAMADRCIAWFNALGDQHFGRYVLNKGGQIHFVEIYRATASYGVIKSTIYHTSDGADVSYGSVVEGKFTGFNHICWQNHNHDDRYYTEEEIDEKFSNVSGGGSAGMLREFESDVTAGAEIADEKTLEWQGNKSKFYTVTVKALETGDTCYYTFTVDYKALSATIGRLKLYQSFPTKKCYLEVFVDSEKHVHFEIGDDSDSNVFLYKVCGYY